MALSIAEHLEGAPTRLPLQQPYEAAFLEKFLSLSKMFGFIEYQQK